MSCYFNLSNVGNFSRISGIGKNVAKKGSVIFSSAKLAAILFTVVFVSHCQAECKQVFQWQKGLVGQCLAGPVFTCNFHCLIRPY